jgi:hypothetical protein
MQSAVLQYALQPICYIFLLLEDLIILHPLRMNDFLASAEAANCKVRPATQVMASCNALSVHPFQLLTTAITINRHVCLPGSGANF